MSKLVAWLKRRYWLVLVIIASVWAVLVIFPLKTSPGEPQALFNLGCSSGDCIVEPWVANNRSEYRRLNLSFDHPLQNLSILSRKRYFRAFAKYPDATSCVAGRVQSSDGYDLLQFDWGAHKNPESLKVCLSRIQNAIANPRVSARWFEEFGFSTLSTVNPERSLHGGWTAIHVSWTSDRDFPASAIAPLVYKLFYEQNISLAVRLDRDHIVQNVGIDFNTK